MEYISGLFKGDKLQLLLLVVLKYKKKKNTNYPITNKIIIVAHFLLHTLYIIYVDIFCLHYYIYNLYLLYVYSPTH